MPNGGSDCCATCWFNSAHEGTIGLAGTAPDTEVRCVIRDLDIKHSFCTYCVNHPHHNPNKVNVPIGAVYLLDGGFPYTRSVWVESPDTETVRETLLGLLEAMPEQPQREYSSSPKFDEEVIDQLMRFRERRAVPGLRRVCRFDTFAKPEGDKGLGRIRAVTVAHALEALAALTGDEALPDLARGLGAGLDQAKAMPEYDPGQDRLAVIRYYCVRALQHCSRELVCDLLRSAVDDPNKAIAALATESLATKQ